ncbi:MAG: ABC transporter permease subunit [Chloroflexi bacterium]|nr:ABC transporter permease subunit [Chloroflexota bacterium]
MVKFLIRRLLAAIPVLFAILLVTFTLSHLLPGGPFNAVGQRRMPDYVKEQLEQQFGLNKSLVLNTWNDGYCPEAEEYMEETGCYDEYEKDLERYESHQAYLSNVASYEAWLAANPDYESWRVDYLESLASGTEGEEQPLDINVQVQYVEEQLVPAVNAKTAAEDQLEVANAAVVEAEQRLAIATDTSTTQPDALGIPNVLNALSTDVDELESELAQARLEAEEAQNRLEEAQDTLAARQDEYQLEALEAFSTARSNYDAAKANLEAARAEQDARINLATLEQDVDDALVDLQVASLGAPENPDADRNPLVPDIVVEEEPVKPEPWSLLPITRYETTTLGGGDATASSRKTEKTTKIDLLDSQFFNYMWDAMHLDFGPSLDVANRTQNVQVIDEIRERLPVSMQIGLFAVGLGFLLGIPLGVLAAVYHNSSVDYLAMFFAVLGQSTPAIVLAPILIIIFAVELEWVPVAATDNAWREGPELTLDYVKIMALPVITLGTGMSAGIARLTRASLLQVMHEDYVRTARAKGLRERVVIYVHALKNALIPVVTIVGPLLAGVLTGTFVVELIFVIPGLGKKFVDAVPARDYTMIMGTSLLYSVFLILGNILVDIMYTWLDPRIRFD